MFRDVEEAVWGLNALAGHAAPSPGPARLVQEGALASTIREVAHGRPTSLPEPRKAARELLGQRSGRRSSPTTPTACRCRPSQISRLRCAPA